MKKKTKTDINQLQLDFDNSRSNLEAAVSQFEEAAAKMVEAAANTMKPEVKDNLDAEMDGLRATVRRLIGILVDQSGLPFHAAWVLAYHEMHKNTGYHAVVSAVKRKDETLLDAVQREGRLEDLKTTVTGMLVKPEYAKR